MRESMAEADSGKLKVFVSYSRRDAGDFAEELVAGLALAGFAPFLDRHDIAAGEDWEARLGGLIEQADTVVYVVSPESVKSDRCGWEVDTALKKTKRVLPVLFRPVPESEIPEQLRRRQFVRFDTGPGITRPLAQLADALRQDLDWIREHTRIGEMAGRWDARGRPESLLLRGDDLAAAEIWADTRSSNAPAITDRMREFITASKEAEAATLARSNAAQRRIIRMQSLLTALLVAVIVGLIAWINQSTIRDEWRWFMVTRPYMRAQVRPNVLNATTEQALKPGDAFRECSKGDECPDMIVIPAGRFTMGSPLSEPGRYPNEGPQHQVTIAAALAVSRYEVTAANWNTCVAVGDCPPVSDGGFPGGQQPVINVSYDEAKHYAAWLTEMTGKTYRLLTEAEWEYAARAGTTSIYYWGDDVGTNNADCLHCGSQWDGKQPAPVGSFNPNKFGLYDMAGNVWQWTEDCYHTSYDNAPSDGAAWMTGGNCNSHMARGGAWDYSPVRLRSADRDGYASSTKVFYLGFRVARTLGPSQSQTRPAN